MFPLGKDSRRREERKFKRVVVFRTGHLGDTICAIPAFRLLRNFYNDAKVFLICDSSQQGKVAVIDIINRFDIFEKVFSYKSNKGFSSIWQLFRLIRQIKPDILIQLPQQKKKQSQLNLQLLFFRLSGIKKLAGFNHICSEGDWKMNEPARLIKILNNEGIYGYKPAYHIEVQPAATDSVLQKLKSIGIGPFEDYIIFCGGGKCGTQKWPNNRYAQVLKDIHRSTKVPIIAIGTDEELHLYEKEILPEFPQLNMITVTIDELFELLRSAKCYIGNDTGPMHAAAAVGCPVTGIISARNLPGQWDPDIESRLLIRHRTDCEGCWLDKCIKENHKCMMSITVPEVINEVQPFIKKLIETRG
ncbi:MAG: glycosyltransferase family 9 protein [Deltaproteobacteria bacterium]|nr:glycosyltransferase family 9 protein [Deltaproteobacteria bacterium]